MAFKQETSGIEMKTHQLIVRSLRFLRRVRGWQRFAEAVVPRCSEPHFDVINKHGRHIGSLDDFIQRKLFLFGGYEQDKISLFLELIPKHKSDVILDIGANIGVHTIAFSRTFSRVISFEPSRDAFEHLNRMIKVNEIGKICSYQIALGSENMKLPLRRVDDFNIGLGTLVSAPIYDRPTKETEEVTVRKGDEFLNEIAISHVDAMKIDVQGYEPEVLMGLQETIKRDKPIIWLELSQQARKEGDYDHLLETITSGRNLYKFVTIGRIFRRVKLQLCSGGENLTDGDYVIK